MYLLSLKDRRDDGAYAVLNRYGEKVLFMFEEEDDAERYAMMLNDDENATLNVIEIEDALEADRIFNILMGDKVAPRREFIETHSSNLDMATLDI